LIGDHNGDGNPDIFGIFDPTNANGFYIAHGTGKGFLPYRRVWGGGQEIGWGGRDSEKFPTYFLDINADGKSDIINFGVQGTYVKLSDGNRFEGWKTWTSEFGQTTGQSWSSKDFRSFGDFDGDGLVLRYQAYCKLIGL